MSKLKRLSKPFLFLFILVSSIDIIAIIVESAQWQTLSKPLIIPSLMMYYLTTSNQVNKSFLIALFFSFLGDVLLLDKSNLFLFGIGAFLITQLIYIFIFAKGLAATSLGKKVQALAPFMVFYSILISVLKPGLGEFFIPVLIYGFAISIFGSVTLLKYLNKKSTTTLSLLCSAILFIVSDSMIAFNKFHQEHFLYPVAIMITYIVAQYLIARFMLISEKSQSN